MLRYHTWYIVTYLVLRFNYYLVIIASKVFLGDYVSHVLPSVCLALLMRCISHRNKDGIYSEFLSYYIQCGVCVTSTVDFQHYF